MAPLVEDSFEPSEPSVPEEPAWIRKQAAHIPCYDSVDGAPIRRSRNFAAHQHRAAPVPRCHRTVESSTPDVGLLLNAMRVNDLGQYIPSSPPAGHRWTDRFPATPNFKAEPPPTPPPPPPSRPMMSPMGNPSAPSSSAGNPEQFSFSSATPVGRCATAPARSSRAPPPPAGSPGFPSAPPASDPEAPMGVPPSLSESMSSAPQLPTPQAAPQIWTPPEVMTPPDDSSSSSTDSRGTRVHSKTNSSASTSASTSSSAPGMKPKDLCPTVEAHNQKHETSETPKKQVQNLFAKLKMRKVRQMHPQAGSRRRSNSCFGGCITSVDDSDSEAEQKKEKAKNKEDKAKLSTEQTAKLLKEQHRRSWRLSDKRQWWKPGVWLAAARCHMNNSVKEADPCSDTNVNTPCNNGNGNSFIGISADGASSFQAAVPSPGPTPTSQQKSPSTKDQTGLGQPRSFSSEPRVLSEKIPREEPPREGASQPKPEKPTCRISREGNEPPGEEARQPKRRSSREGNEPPREEARQPKPEKPTHRTSREGNVFPGVDLPGSPSLPGVLNFEDEKGSRCPAAAPAAATSFCRSPASAPAAASSFCRSPAADPAPAASFCRGQSSIGSLRAMSSMASPKSKNDEFVELVSSLKRLGRVEAEQRLINELDRISLDPMPEERRRRLRALQRSIHPDKWPQEQQELATTLFQTLQSRKDQACTGW